MVISSVSNSPGYAERINKSAKPANSFQDVLNNEMASKLQSDTLEVSHKADQKNNYSENIAPEQQERIKELYGQLDLNSTGISNGSLDEKMDMSVSYGNDTLRDFFGALADNGVISKKDSEYASGTRCFSRSLSFINGCSVEEYVKEHNGYLIAPDAWPTEVYSSKKSSDIFEYLDNQIETMESLKHKAGKNGGATVQSHEVSLFMPTEKINECLDSLIRVKAALLEFDFTKM